MPWLRKPIPHRQGGFTLIEVMVGIVLTAILVLGLTAMWAAVGEEFLRLGLRQKAIFALNGEMERLVMVHRSTAPAEQTVTIGGANRQIYASTYPDGAIVDQDANFQIGEVFYYDAGNGIGTDDRNLVWLDTAKNVVGAVNWGYTALANGEAAFCSAVDCQQITLYIDFPYRFDLATQTLTQMPPVRTLSLQTIVARK